MSDILEKVAMAINELANVKYNFYYVGKAESRDLACAAIEALGVIILPADAEVEVEDVIKYYKGGVWSSPCIVNGVVKSHIDVVWRDVKGVLYSELLDRNEVVIEIIQRNNQPVLQEQPDVK